MLQFLGIADDMDHVDSICVHTDGDHCDEIAMTTHGDLGLAVDILHHGGKPRAENARNSTFATLSAPRFTSRC